MNGVIKGRGSFRFLNRIWRLVTESYQVVKDNDLGTEDSLSGQEKELRYVLHNTIKRVTTDIGERFNFNTAISAIMELVNATYDYLEKNKDGNLNRGILKETVTSMLMMLAPFLPI